MSHVGGATSCKLDGELEHDMDALQTGRRFKRAANLAVKRIVYAFLNYEQFYSVIVIENVDLRWDNGS